MADLDAVLTSIGQAVSAALAAASVQATVFTGWPTAEDLNRALKEGRLQVSVHPRTGMNSSVPRRIDGWEPTPAVVPAMTAEVQSNETDVLFAGNGAEGQIAAVEADGRAWAAPATGTPEETAAALLVLIADDRPVSVVGGLLQIPGAVGLEARVVSARSERRVLGEDQQAVQITVWAPTVALRDAATPVVNLWARRTQFLDLAASEQARLVYDGMMTDDEGRQSGLHRRDVMVSATFCASEVLAHPVTAASGHELTVDGKLLDRRVVYPPRPLINLVSSAGLVPALSRPQPGGALAAAFSAPNVVDAYAENVPRFPFGGPRMRFDGVEATNLLLDSAVLTTRTAAVTPGTLYVFSFFGTGSVDISTASATTIFDTTVGYVEASNFNCVGLGAGLGTGCFLLPTDSEITLTVTGDVTFAILSPAAFNDRFAPGNRLPFYIPTTTEPLTVGRDALEQLSFPAIFPAGKGTILISGIQGAHVTFGERNCAFFLSNDSRSKVIALCVFPDVLRLIAGNDQGAMQNASPDYSLLLWKQGTKATVGVTFNRSGRCAIYAAGDAVRQISCPDPMGMTSILIGGEFSLQNNDFGGVYSPFVGEMSVAYKQTDLNDADLIALVDEAHAGP